MRHSVGPTNSAIKMTLNVSAVNRRKMLGPALFNIRFPLISIEDFTKGVVSTGVLITEEVYSIYQHHCHSELSDAPGLFPLAFPTHRRYKNGETIEMEIKKVSKFALEAVESYRLSDAVDIWGFSLRITAENTKKNAEKWLGFLLYYDDPEKGLSIFAYYIHI
ncbi:hypothetical protein niasHT_016516 [Heterodera trifolii]|uniref:Uncharacterized protein n=1 Tax=Heterodera trifolii TaxID=157864 RepID=A0ABD2L460_9BILA